MLYGKKQKLIRKLADEISKHSLKDTLTSEIVYDLLSQYKMGCIKNDLDANGRIDRSLNRYEIKEIKNAYDYKQNTDEFNEWFDMIMGIERPYKSHTNSFLKKIMKIIIGHIVPTLLGIGVLVLIGKCDYVVYFLLGCIIYWFILPIINFCSED